MTSLNRSALVNFSAKQMYDLVNDIENYPHFMQGCQAARRSEEHTSELQSRRNLVCRLLLEKKKKTYKHIHTHNHVT